MKRYESVRHYLFNYSEKIKTFQKRLTALHNIACIHKTRAFSINFNQLFLFCVSNKLQVGRSSVLVFFLLNFHSSFNNAILKHKQIFHQRDIILNENNIYLTNWISAVCHEWQNERTKDKEASLHVHWYAEAQTRRLTLGEQWRWYVVRRGAECNLR